MSNDNQFADDSDKTALAASEPVSAATARGMRVSTSAALLAIDAMDEETRAALTGTMGRVLNG